MDERGKNAKIDHVYAALFWLRFLRGGCLSCDWVGQASSYQIEAGYIVDGKTNRRTGGCVISGRAYFPHAPSKETLASLGQAIREIGLDPQEVTREIKEVYGRRFEFTTNSDDGDIDNECLNECLLGYELINILKMLLT